MFTGKMTAKIRVKPAVGILLSAMLLGMNALVAVPMWASPAAQTESDMSQLKSLSGKDFEIDFMNMMIQHHQSALDMANLVPDRAKHQELKDTAQKIITDQTREINDMTAWLKQWYSVSPMAGMMHDTPGMSMADMSMLANLKGDEFDKQFLTMMRTHHTSAVEMAGLVPDRATHSELKTLGQNIISSQTAEIQKFEGWLKAWYNVDAGSMVSMTGGETAGNTTSGGTEMPDTGSGDGGFGLALLALAGVAVGSVLLAGGAWLRKRT